MKFFPRILIGLLGFLLLSVSRMSADDETRISKAEFERLWQTPTDVVGTVESYTKGKGDALTYEYEGHLNLCSDDIAVVTVPGDEQKKPRKLRLSIPRKEAHEWELFKKVGGSVKFSIPLLYMKYDPWGFVPSEDLKCISELKAKGEPSKTGSADSQGKPQSPEPAK
jgi:hypothetical protein